MASFMSYFTGRRDSKQTARDAIVSLREQLMMIEKKEEHLQRQITQDVTTAKANAVSNKAGTPLSPLGATVLNGDDVAARHFIHYLSGHCCAAAEEDARGGA